jgi:phospho-N-acetylmuramoyl-pentapeptide-transferase
VLTSALTELLGVNLFGYITFRMAMAAFTAFALALWMGKPTIAWLKRHRVREDVSKSDSVELARAALASGKADTPTMGGSFLVAALLGSVLLWAHLDHPTVVLAVLLVAGLAAVGFVDDYKKLTIPGCSGLSRGAKMLGLTLAAGGAVAAFAYYASSSGREALLALHPPFFKDWVIHFAAWGGAGIALFVVFQWFVVVGTSNATNITDGMDGLAAGCMIITGLALTLFCYVTGREDWTWWGPAWASCGSTPTRRRSSWATRGACPSAACSRGWRWSRSRSSSSR